MRDYADEQIWLDEIEKRCVELLRERHADFEGDLDITWCVHPVVSLWKLDHEGHSYWFLAGDLPTDLIEDPKVKKPKDAMRAFCTRWDAAAKELLAGRKPEGLRIGNEGRTIAQRKKLGDLLKKRATLLREWADTPAKWKAGL